MYSLHIPTRQTLEPSEQPGTLHFAVGETYNNEYSHLVEDDAIGGEHAPLIADTLIDGHYCVPIDTALTTASALSVTQHIISVSPQLIVEHMKRDGKLDGWTRTDQYPADWPWIRRMVLERDGFACQECGVRDAELHVHHLTPIDAGGTHAHENLSTLCRRCHGSEHPFSF